MGSRTIVLDFYKIPDVSSLPLSPRGSFSAVDEPAGSSPSDKTAPESTSLNPEDGEFL